MAFGDKLRRFFKSNNNENNETIQENKAEKDNIHEKNDNNSDIEKETIQENKVDEDVETIETQNIIEESANIKNFKYLDDLIHGGSKEIILDSDFILENGCVHLSFDDNGIIIDGNGHVISSSSRTFHVTGSNITLKNIIFKNHYVEDNTVRENAKGSCLINEGELNIINCNFENNYSSSDGGAIYNNEKGFLKVKNCNFENNYSSSDGGAIYNNGELVVQGCCFDSNFAGSKGGAICNAKPYFPIGGGIIKKFYAEHAVGTYSIIDNCSFLNNISEYAANSIFNNFYVKIFNSRFEDNSLMESSLIYQNNEESKMIIIGSYISSQCAKIHNEGGFFKIESSQLTSKNELIVNEGVAEIKKLKIYQCNEKIMFNNSNLKILDDNSLIENIEQGENSKITYFYSKLPLDYKGFNYLDDLIHNDSKDVSIECDITMHGAEQDFYEGGIVLDIDDLVIDGNFHEIDAQQLSRIFYITGNNILIKNLVLKGGKFFTNYLTKVDDGGGAILILNNASVKFVNCKFVENESQISGGSLCNKGDLKLQNCTFENNEAKKYGGAINNLHKILNIENCKFLSNKTLGEGGAINNKLLITCINSYFFNNHGDGENNGGGGGVLKNTQTSNNIACCTFNSCEFEENSTRNEGGVVNIWGGRVLMKNCIFRNNTAWNGDVIFSREYFVFYDKYQFIDCEFINNDSTFDKDIDD